MASFPLLMIIFALLRFNFAHDAFVSSKNASEFVSSDIDEEAAMQIAALFRENFQQPFSWENPELLRLLTRELEGSDAKDATQKQSKRVSGTYFSQQTAPILNFPQCVGCANAAQRTWVLEDFTNQFFMDRRLIAPENLVDKCVFYTQRPSIDIVPGLSQPATVWACNQVPVQWKTIWVRIQFNSIFIQLTVVSTCGHLSQKRVSNTLLEASFSVRLSTVFEKQSWALYP